MRRVTFKAERSVSVRLFCDGHVLGWCMKFFFRRTEFFEWNEFCIPSWVRNCFPIKNPSKFGEMTQVFRKKSCFGYNILFCTGVLPVPTIGNIGVAHKWRQDFCLFLTSSSPHVSSFLGLNIIFFDVLQALSPLRWCHLWTLPIHIRGHFGSASKSVLSWSFSRVE